MGLSRLALRLGQGAWSLALLLVSAHVAPARVLAGNDDGILLGNDAALMGGAVVSTVNDGSALWYNPAGLALASENSVDVGASAFALRRYNMPGLISADGGRGGDASFTEIVSIPSALTYVRRFSPRTVGGLALFASELSDYSLRTSLSVPIGAVTDAGTFFTIDGNIKLLLTQEAARYHLAGGLATSLPRGFSVGFSLFGDYYDESGLTQASSTYTVMGQPVTSRIDSAYAQTKVLGFHLRAGVVYQPSPLLKLGLSVQTPGVYFYQSGRITSVVSNTEPGADGNLLLETESSDVSASEVHLGLYSPVRLRFGGAYSIAGGTVTLEGDVQSKLSDSEIGIEREFVWNLRAGARYPVGKTLHVGAGFFTDRGSQRKDQWGAGAIDFYGATLGGQYDSVRWLASDEKAADGTPKRSGLTFSSTVALRYAYGSGKLPGQSLQAPDYTAVTQATDLTVHELTVHLGSGVYF